MFTDTKSTYLEILKYLTYYERSDGSRRVGAAGL